MNCERYGNKEQDYLRQYCQEEKIIYTLIHTERNREKLAGTPHRNIMDLSLTYRSVSYTHLRQKPKAGKGEAGYHGL